MSFPIDTTIPLESNDPIDDVPLIRGNFNNINSYLKVDHVEAGAVGNGFHKKVTYYDVAVPAVPVGNTSVGFTALGSAAPAVPEGRFINSSGTFPTTAIRACVLFAGDSSSPVGNALPLLNSFNVDKVERAGGTLYKITLTAGATTGTDFLVFIFKSDGNGTSYTKTNNVVQSINVGNAVLVNVIIVQI